MNNNKAVINKLFLILNNNKDILGAVEARSKSAAKIVWREVRKAYAGTNVRYTFDVQELRSDVFTLERSGLRTKKLQVAGAPSSVIGA